MTSRYYLYSTIFAIMISMKITKIEKKKRLYLLEIDKNQHLYVTEDTIVRFMLSKDKDIDEKTLTEIKTYAQYSHGKNLALYHLSFKQRTSFEVKKYLIEHDIDEKIILDILKELKAEKWIDDTKYIENVLQQNLNSGNKGSYILKQKLRQKGLSAQLIDQELQKINFMPLAKKVALKLLNKYQKKLSKKALKEKITQSLITKGFSYQETNIAIDSLDIQSDYDQEESLLKKELEKQYRKYSRKYDGYELKQRLIQALARRGFGFDDINSALREYL